MRDHQRRRPVLITLNLLDVRGSNCLRQRRFLVPRSSSVDFHTWSLETGIPAVLKARYRLERFDRMLSRRSTLVDLWQGEVEKLGLIKAMLSEGGGWTWRNVLFPS